MGIKYGDKYPHMWRDMIVRETIEELGMQIIFLNETTRSTAENSGGIFWLPVHDESRHNWVDLHKVHPTTGNCEATHVCQAPGLWGNMFGTLTNVML